MFLKKKNFAGLQYRWWAVHKYFKAFSVLEVCPSLHSSPDNVLTIKSTSTKGEILHRITYVTNA
jgi:hypothetical protein